MNQENDDRQTDLFEPMTDNSSESKDISRPLAFRARPDQLEGLKGQERVFIRFPFLLQQNFPSLILFGPPGSGKTTLAHILANRSNKDLYPFNAVLAGVNELKKLIQRAEEIRRYHGREAIIFIDEIHRFNKAQQDALLPYIEAGQFTLIGATTENPRRSINRALLSRLQTVELNSLKESDLIDILASAAKKFDIPFAQDVAAFIASYSSGDARKALNLFELVEQNKNLSFEQLKPIIVENSRNYDRSDDRHYDVISAFIKSVRGSDPDAALLWLAVMLDGGEDPVFIARRLVISASEDVGNADIHALPLAIAALQAVQNIGMPEARICLAQATTYLASTVKSNAAYLGINSALEFVQTQQTIDTPNHIKNRPIEGKAPYLYPHDYPNSFVEQQYAPTGTPLFYRPKEIGHEGNIFKRLKSLWKNRY